MASFVVVAQWQGSGSARAMQLIDGADAIRGDLPRASTVVVDVPTEAGESQDTGVDRITSLLTIRDRANAALDAAGDPVITVGGDCGVELAPVQRAARQWGDRLGVVWFDAHPDLHTPQSSSTHAFHGMVLRTLLGDGDPRLAQGGAAISPDRLVLAGARSFDDTEARYVREQSITRFAPEDLGDPSAVCDRLATAGVEAVYLHIDLDVLDPVEMAGIGFPEPFGLSTADLIAAITALRARFTLAGAGVTEFAPSSTSAAVDDLPTILRIVGALAKPRA